MQHEITFPNLLLDLQGNIAEPGYAKSLLWPSSRSGTTIILATTTSVWP